MDSARDFKPFQKLMDKLWAILRGAKEAPDSYVNAMWDGLSDVPISEIEAHVGRIIATATKDTPLPKPRDLRNRPRQVAAPDARRDAAMYQNERNWRELKASDPIRFQIEAGIACAARELSQLDADDPGYKEWEREYQRWAAIRYAPRAIQEATVAKYLGRT